MLDKDFYTSLSNSLKVIYASVFFSHKYFSCFHRQLVAGGDGGERQVQSLDKDFYIFLYFSCFSSFPRQLLLDWWQVVMEGSGR